jgi:hypothetical protein
MYLGIHAKCPLLLSELKETEFSRQVLEKYVIRFHEYLSSRGQIIPCGRTDRLKLIVAFRNIAKSAKKWSVKVGVKRAWTELTWLWIRADGGPVGNKGSGSIVCGEYLY